MIKKLNSGERIILLQLMPKEHNILTLKIIKAFSEKIGLTSEEIEVFTKAKQDNAKLEKIGSLEKEFDLSEAEIELVSAELHKLDKANKLTMNHLAIYDKFINKK